MTERLQVTLVPHQRLVTSVRHDVVNVGSRYCAALGEALCAERMIEQEALAKLSPSVAIASLGSGAFLLQAPIPALSLLRFLSLAASLLMR